MSNKMLAILGVLAIAIGIYTYFHRTQPQVVPANIPKLDRSFAWRFSETTPGADQAPRTKVALITNGQVYETGPHVGSCAEIPARALLPNEVAAVLCWYAGGGDEIGVFKENGHLIIQVGVQQEGTADSNGFRGNFQPVYTIE